MSKSRKISTDHTLDGKTPHPQRGFTTDLKSHVEEQIIDPKLKQLLDQAAQDPTLYSGVLKHLFNQIHIARDTNLYPTKDHLPEPGKTNPQRWELLVSDAGNVALKLFERVFMATDERRRQYYAKQVVLALRLMLLARFYAIRAMINENATATEVVSSAFEQPQKVVKYFLKESTDYDKQVRDWGLHRILPTGWKENGDAIAYKTWSRDFGKGSDTEVDWSPFTRAIGSELHYQSRKMEVRQRWSEVWCVAFTPTDRARRESGQMQRQWSEEWHVHPGIQTPVRFLQALLLWIFKVIAGFGLKPLRFACTVILTISTFSILYFFDDVWARCNHVAWSLTAYGQEIYYAIGNFTSVGTGSSGPCGPLTDVFISIETLMGYFLLSVLAAMLIARIIDR